MPGNVFFELLGIAINFDEQNTLEEIERHRVSMVQRVDMLLQNSSMEELTQKYPGIPKVIATKKDHIRQTAAERIKAVTEADRQLDTIAATISECSFNFKTIADKRLLEPYLESIVIELNAYPHDLVKKAYAALNIKGEHPKISTAIAKKIEAMKLCAKQRSMELSCDLLREQFLAQGQYALDREDIEILIAAKQRKRAINCHVVAAGIPCSPHDFLEALIRKGAARTQLIFRGPVSQHWSVLDILRAADGTLKIFFLDAAGNLFNKPGILAFCLKNKIDLTFCMGKLQKDGFSCSIFAVDHAFHMSKIADLHEHIARVRRPSVDGRHVFTVAPIDLPAPLVKNVQSTRFLTKYLAMHPEQKKTPVNKKGQTVLEYAESYAVVNDDARVYGAIYHKQQQYRQKINAYILEQERLTWAKQQITTTIKVINTFDVCFNQLNTQEKIKQHKVFLLARLDAGVKNNDLINAYQILGLNNQHHPRVSLALQAKQQQINQEAIVQVRRLFLCSIHFDKHISTFAAKAEAIKNKALLNKKYSPTAKILSDFCLAVINAQERFLHSNLDVSLGATKKRLALECQKALTPTQKTLGLRSEWSNLFKLFSSELYFMLHPNLNAYHFMAPLKEERVYARSSLPPIQPYNKA